jgi:NitT/TauT family transport system permease protein
MHAPFIRTPDRRAAIFSLMRKVISRLQPALGGLIWPAASATIFIALWAAAAAWLHSRYLPAPAAVLDRLAAGVASGELTYHVGVTLARVTVSFILAMAIGSVIGVAMGRLQRLDRLFDGWLILFLNLPALMTIFLCYIWFGLNEVAAVIAVAVNKIPNVAVTLREGARALDRDYLEMAQAYRFGPWKTLRHVIAPQLAPYFAAATRSGLSLVWKIVLVVEMLGRSSGVGFQLHVFFQTFDVADLLAYALAFIMIIQAVELLLIQPWERSVNRWRK